ncbi:single-stranded-DNA-specific exonuclease RecJ [Pseudanabaena biceps]|nr:single-stranded-DNA-specific exonuclease RecJ [Pseudanabaena biceps]
MSLTDWQIVEKTEPPDWLQAKVGKFAAQLLSDRGIIEPEQVAAFLSPSAYQPTSAFAFGEEIKQAITRIREAWQQGETIAIWGDFDADGITATSVLWEGLGQFFAQGDRLVFYIPDRLKASHGISITGLDELRSQCEIAGQNLGLIITCDTGSTCLAALNYAQTLGIDVIVTDHHTLPDHRPPVVAIINPRYLSESHPLFHLSGVAVAYKLMEVVYADFAEKFPELPQQPLENLLDLVAIGLIADLVQLTGDCRYLAQRGMEVLRQKKRLGVRLLLEQCKKVGDRPIDISFGIAPRINAVSRIWGDVRKCVELLTTKDEKICKNLIDQMELANTERKSLQKKVFKQVQSKIEKLDLSTTGIIILVDPQWSVGVLGLVAGQVVSEYGRPTILCTVEDGIAKGSARSLSGINLYDLLKEQEHLLLSFGGHPLAGGLSFHLDNLQVLIEAIDQKFWSQYGQLQNKTIAIDLEVKITDLNRDLSNQLRKLEPFGMGNPHPRLLLRDCTFTNKFNANIRNYKGQKVEYIRTEFILSDRDDYQIHGDWWGHYSYELPDETLCDVIVEIVDNAPRDRYDIRLLDFHPHSTPRPSKPSSLASTSLQNPEAKVQIIDCRGSDLTSLQPNLAATICDRCPQSWHDLNKIIASAEQASLPIALLYNDPHQINGAIAWQTLVGIAKYLSRTGKEIRRSQLMNKIGIDDLQALQIGFEELQKHGFQVEEIAIYEVNEDDLIVKIITIPIENREITKNFIESNRFIQAANELSFHKQFFDRFLQNFPKVYPLNS